MKDLRIIRDDPSFAGGDYSQDQDAFNHEAFADTLFNVVKDNDPPLTVGLFGGWGVGKSSIINRLEAKCRSSADVFAYVSFNAWAYSGDSLRRQLLLAIARGLIKDKPKREIELEKLRKLNYAQVLEELPGHSLKDLWDKARGEEKVGWRQFNRRNKDESIEHIFPRDSKLECWKERFGQYGKREKEALLHSLGNLLILSQSKNSEMQNKCFDFKSKHVDKRGNSVGYFNGSYSEIEVSENPDWAGRNVLDRGVSMLTFIERRWSISFGTENDKKEILRLTFVE